MVNEVIDAHGRATRLWASARPSRGGLIDFVLTSTFSGAQRPNDHRVVWQTSLSPESLAAMRDVIDSALEAQE